MIPTFFIVPASQAKKITPLIEAKRETYIVVNDAYVNIFNRPERYQILYGGAAAGKSDVKATDLLVKAMVKPFFRLLYCRKNSTEIRDSQFSLFKDIIKRQNWQKYFDYSESKNGNMEITCKLNGNRLIPHGLDDVHKLTSIHDITDVWLEEPLSKSKIGGHITQDDFLELDRRMRTTRATCHFHLTFNPIGTMNWIYNNFFDTKSEFYYQFRPEIKNPKAQPLTYSLKTTFRDNLFIDQEAEDIKFKRQGAYEYRIYAMGDWGLLKAKSPYIHEFSMDKHVHDIGFNSLKPFVLAFDFNLDIMACSVWQVSDPKVYCCYEFPPVTGLHDRCTTILSSRFAPFLDYCTITGDATGAHRDQKTPHMTHYSLIKQRLRLRGEQFKVPRSNMAHSDSRLLCNSVIRNADFAIDRQCINLQADFQMTENDGNDGILKKAHDPHYLDGFRALAQTRLQKYLDLVKR